jgi:AraC-like DNA-binding protein
MRTVLSARPSPQLRPYVRAFAQRSVTGLLPEEQTMPAYLETVLQFDLGEPPTVRASGRGWETARFRSVVGPQTRGGNTLRFAGNVDSFAIFLQPSALWSLFRVPTSLVMDTYYDTDDVLGRPVAELWDILMETPSFPERVKAAEMLLTRYVIAASSPTTATAAAASLVRRGGRIAIHDLASTFNVSVRQMERSFVHEIGVTPKHFARIARFQTALDTRVQQPDRAWLDIATASGYYDQMHLVHDFHALGGLPPNLTLVHLGDSRPAALAASHSHSRDDAIRH